MFTNFKFFTYQLKSLMLKNSLQSIVTYVTILISKQYAEASTGRPTAATLLKRVSGTGVFL